MSSGFHNSTLKADSNPCFEDEKTVASKREQVLSEMTLVKKNTTEASLSKKLQNKNRYKSLFSLESFINTFYCLAVCICLGDMLGKLFLLPFYFFSVQFLSASNVFCDVVFVKLFNNALWPGFLSLAFIFPIYIGYLYHCFMVTKNNASECSKNKMENPFIQNIPTNIVPIQISNGNKSLRQQVIQSSDKSRNNRYFFSRPKTRIFTLVCICAAAILSIPAVLFFNYFFSIGFLVLYILGGHGNIVKKNYLHCEAMTFCKANDFFWCNNSIHCHDKDELVDISDIESGTIHGVESLCDPFPEKSTLQPTKWKYEGTSGGMIADMEGHLDITYGILPPNAREEDNSNVSLAGTRATRFQNKSLKTVSADQVMDSLCNVAGYDTKQIKNGTKHSPLSRDCNFSFVSHAVSMKTKKTNKSTISKYKLHDCHNSAVLSQKNKISFAFPGVLLPNVKASPASVIKGAFDGKYPGTHSWFLTMIKRLQKIQKKDVTYSTTTLCNNPTLLHSDFHLPGTGSYFELTYLEENIFIWFIHRLQYRLFQCMCDHWEMTLKPSSIIAPCDTENLEKDIPVQLCQSACHMARLSNVSYIKKPRHFQTGFLPWTQQKNCKSLKDLKEITNSFTDTTRQKIARSSASSFSQDDFQGQNNAMHVEDDSTDQSSSYVDRSFTESSSCTSSTLSKSSSEMYTVSVFEKSHIKGKEEGKKQTLNKLLVPEKLSWLQTLFSYLLFQPSRNCASLSAVKNVSFEYVDSCCTASVNNNRTVKHCLHEDCRYSVQNTKALTNSPPVFKSSKFIKDSKRKKLATRFCNKTHVYEASDSTDAQPQASRCYTSKKGNSKEESFLLSGTVEGKTHMCIGKKCIKLYFQNKK
jgi:hypothetical protein